MNSERDWGFAGDYVQMMWMMMQQDEPDDYVVATGVKRTVRDFVNNSFNELGIELYWKGEGVEEKGIDKSTGKILVEVDPKYFRPAEVELLIGDLTKAKEKLGWEAKVSLKELVSMMVKNDLEEAEKELHLKNGGYEVKNYYE
jgi:GDPmannose 4,6-dehydratase